MDFCVGDWPPEIPDKALDLIADLFVHFFLLPSFVTRCCAAKVHSRVLQVAKIENTVSVPRSSCCRVTTTDANAQTREPT